MARKPTTRKTAKRTTTSKASRGSDPAQRAISAALDLAAEEGWRNVTMRRVAARAGITLGALYGLFPSRLAILNAFFRRVDSQVLEGDVPELADEAPKDRLFDVIMRRFEALGPHKEAVRAIAYDLPMDPLSGLCVGGRFMTSMSWMLEAADLARPGLRGRLRVKGLAAIYMRAFSVWLRDDSEDMAATMAALDRMLRRVDAVIGRCRGMRPRPTEPQAAGETA
jgi:AcrR family transcriptional regulator